MDTTTLTSVPVPANLEQATWQAISDDWYSHGLEKATKVETGDGLVWVRKRNSPEQLYVTNPDCSNWRCAKCSTDLLGAQVAHPVHDGPFPLSGGGQCEYEEAPYCPTCEKKPDFHGTPITVGGKV